MFRIFLLLLLPKTVIEYEKPYTEIVEECNYNDAIILSNHYLLIKEEESFKVINTLNEKLLYQNTATEVTITYDYLQNKLIVIEYYLNNLKLIEYEKDILLKETILTTEENITNIILKEQNDCIFLLYNDSLFNINCIDLRNNYKKVLGGTLEDILVDFKIYNNNIYLIVYKDALSGGDFGYGGSGKSIVIAILDFDFNVINYITLSEEFNYKGFDVNKNNLYLYLNNNIYLFSNNLEYLLKMNVEGEKFIKSGINNYLLIFYDNYFKIINNITFKVIEEVSYDFSNYLIYELDEFIYLKSIESSYIFDFISFEEINFNQTYINTIDELKKATSLYHKLVDVSKNYQEKFNPSVYGFYYLSIDYKTNYIEFSLNTKEEVLLNVNVFNDIIYPSGYRLMFNGTAYLNQVLIINNYPVQTPGVHTLIIYGSNVETTIKFSVSKTQISFVDDFSNCDIFINVSSNVTLYYLCENIITEDIVSIDLEGNEIESFVIENDLLKITLETFTYSGYYKIFLKSITITKPYTENLFYQETIYFNKYYYINVLKELPVINYIEIDEFYKISYDCIDQEKSLRMIEVELFNSQTNFYYTFPITNGLIVVPKGGNYNGRLSFIIYLGGGMYDKIELFTFKVNSTYDNFKLCDFQINQLTTSVDKFNITISTDINSITVGNKTIQIETSSYLDYIKTIGIGVIITLGISVSLLIIRKKLKSRSQK